MKDRVIAFHVEIARELGSINAALFYQQIRHFNGKGSREDGFFYKTQKEMEEETSLTREQQESCRKILIEKRWIDAKKIHFNGSNVWHYRLLVDFELRKVTVRSGEIHSSEVGKSTVPLYTEITIEDNKACVLKNSKGEDLTSMKASEYSPDGWSPLDRKKMLRSLSRSLGEKKTNAWSQLLFGSSWDFKKAFLHFQGYEYTDTILLDEVSKTLAKWYEQGETRDSIRDMITAFFKGKKAQTVTITPNSVFSSHTYNSWKQNKL